MTSGVSASIDGVQLRTLETHADERGTFTEFFRETWVAAPRFVQWNAVTSRRGTLRGVHAHRRHADYLVLLSGQLWLGLVDLRKGRITDADRSLIQMDATQPIAVAIPVGVAHGFYFSADSLHVYGVTEYHDPADELGCRWDDPELGVAWPGVPAHLSPRDRQLGSMRDLLAALGG